MFLIVTLHCNKIKVRLKDWKGTPRADGDQCVRKQQRQDFSQAFGGQAELVENSHWKKGVSDAFRPKVKWIEKTGPLLLCWKFVFYQAT